MRANGSLTSKEFREQRRFDKRFREKAKHKVPPSYSRAEESARSPNGRRDDGLLMEEYRRGARPTSAPSPLQQGPNRSRVEESSPAVWSAATRKGNLRARPTSVPSPLQQVAE